MKVTRRVEKGQECSRERSALMRDHCNHGVVFMNIFLERELIVFLPFLKKASNEKYQKRCSNRGLCCGGLSWGNFLGNGPWNVLNMGERAKQT